MNSGNLGLAGKLRKPRLGVMQDPDRRYFKFAWLVEQSFSPREKEKRIILVASPIRSAKATPDSFYPA